MAYWDVFFRNFEGFAAGNWDVGGNERNSDGFYR